MCVRSFEVNYDRWHSNCNLFFWLHKNVKTELDRWTSWNQWIFPLALLLSHSWWIYRNFYCSARKIFSPLLLQMARWNGMNENIILYDGIIAIIHNFYRYASRFIHTQLNKVFSQFFCSFSFCEFCFFDLLSRLVLSPLQPVFPYFLAHFVHVFYKKKTNFVDFYSLHGNSKENRKNQNNNNALFFHHVKVRKIN